MSSADALARTGTLALPCSVKCRPGALHVHATILRGVKPGLSLSRSKSHRRSSVGEARHTASACDAGQVVPETSPMPQAAVAGLPESKH